jgi:hypothetical protein
MKYHIQYNKAWKQVISLQVLSCFLIGLLLLISCQSKERETAMEYGPTLPSTADTVVKSPSTADTNFILISAIDLTADYIANEVKADHNYKNRQLVVRGVITEIKKGITDKIYVILQGTDRTRSVQCNYDNEEEAMTLKKGMKVYFKGECAGLWGNVILKNCERVGEFVH